MEKNSNYSFKRDSQNPPLQKTTVGHTILSSEKIELNDNLINKTMGADGEAKYSPVSFVDNPEFLAKLNIPNNYDDEILQAEIYSKEHFEESEILEELEIAIENKKNLVATKIKFCRKCGNEFEELDNFCCNCGSFRK